MVDAVNLAEARERQSSEREKTAIMVPDLEKIAVLHRLHDLVEEVGAWWRNEAAPDEIPKTTDLMLAGPDGRLLALTVGIETEKDSHS
jgi:hypothetical protein